MYLTYYRTHQCYWLAWHYLTCGIVNLPVIFWPSPLGQEGGQWKTTQKTLAPPATALQHWDDVAPAQIVPGPLKRMEKTTPELNVELGSCGGKAPQVCVHAHVFARLSYIFKVNPTFSHFPSSFRPNGCFKCKCHFFLKVWYFKKVWNGKNYANVSENFGAADFFPSSGLLRPSDMKGFHFTHERSTVWKR